MPSLGHVAVGLAAGRFHAEGGGRRLAATALFTVLATFPDLDVLARRLGAGRGSPWLHRGALHSLALAACAGVVAALLAGGLGRSRLRTALTGAAAAASHGLLDTLTGGGAGVMLLWPFDRARLLAPWTLLPAAPFGLRLLSHHGLEVLATEAILFLPLLVFALWPDRVARPGPSSAARPAR
jgi:inner membrane protein